MKKILKSALILSAIASTAHAGCNANGCYDVTIDRLSITDSGKIVVGTSGTETSLDCTAPSGVYMTMDATLPGKNAIYSLLLTSKTTKSKVSIRIINGSSNCKIAYAFVE